MNVTNLTSLASEGAVLAAAHGAGWGDGDGWWWIARLAFTALWIILVVFVVRWLFFGRWGRRRWGESGIDRARGILAERYARGEIDANEYHERLDRLK